MTMDLKCPTSAAELTASQAMFVAKLYFIGVSREEFLTRCFLEFTGLKLLKRYPVEKTDDPDCLSDVFELRYKKRRFTLTGEQFGAFCERLSFLVDRPAEIPCPETVAGYRRPDYRLFDASLEEWLTADAFYANYLRSKGESGLDEMIAVLYRPQGEPYSDEGFETRLPDIKKSKQVPKTAFLLWYVGLKAFFRREYPFVFRPSDGSEDVSPHKTIFALLESLNDGRPQENERILKTRLHEVLYSLNEKIKTVDEFKKNHSGF